MVVIISKEMPVHILSLQIGPVIANHYAVRVDLRKDPPLKLVSHFLGVLIL